MDRIFSAVLEPCSSTSNTRWWRPRFIRRRGFDRLPFWALSPWSCTLCLQYHTASDDPSSIARRGSTDIRHCGFIVLRQYPFNAAAHGRPSAILIVETVAPAPASVPFSFSPWECDLWCVFRLAFRAKCRPDGSWQVVPQVVLVPRLQSWHIPPPSLSLSSLHKDGE